MLSTLRLEEPPVLKEAPLDDARWALPFSAEVGEHRRGGRGLLVRFKPRPDDPVDPSSPSPLDWALKARLAGVPITSLTGAAVRAAMAATSLNRPADDLPPAAALPPRASTSPTEPAAAVAAAARPTSSSAADPSTDRSARAPSDSYLELIFPFNTSPKLREQYQRFTSDRTRFGLLLEDLDTLAGDIAARHAGVFDRVLLTASIDRISRMMTDDPAVGDVTLSSNLRMAGQVVWAGRSSMEVMIELSHQPPGSDPGDWKFIGVAFFVLVGRTLDRTAAADVPPLVPQTQRERQLFEQGKMHMQQRQQRRDAHWDRRPPTSEEVALVHDLIRQQYLHRAGAHHHHHHHQETVPMHRTVLQSCCLMHSQDRNVFDVIFGGHLLRLAYEHAFSTAALHAGEYCDPVSMDDVAFLMPVPIGTLLRLTGKVVYAEGPVVRVHVRATKLEPGAPEQSVVTNVFSFAFRCPSGPVRRVIPETMVEAMEYVTGHRQNANDESSQTVLAAAAAAQMAARL